MGSWRNEDSGLKVPGQKAGKFYLYHQPNHLGHRAVWNSGSEEHFYIVVGLQVNSFQIYYIKLLKSKRVFWIVDVPDQLKDLQLIIRVINSVILFCLIPCDF